jgi:hypothetical protein
MSIHQIRQYRPVANSIYLIINLGFDIDPIELHKYHSHTHLYCQYTMKTCPTISLYGYDEYTNQRDRALQRQVNKSIDGQIDYLDNWQTTTTTYTNNNNNKVCCIQKRGIRNIPVDGHCHTHQHGSYQAHPLYHQPCVHNNM